MERGLYIAASGMLAEQVRQDQLANDLANASTPGYKADRVSQHSFAAELDLVNRQTGAPVGGLGLGAQIAVTQTDLSPEVLKDTGEALDLPASALTITIGFGPSLFDDRFGLKDKRPERLIDLPRFPQDDLDPARSNGDICIQACANDPQVAVHAIRNLVRIGFGRVAVRWSQLGFGRTSSTTRDQATPRNMFGFKDGTRNIKAEDTDHLRDHVWVSKEDGPDWLVGGTYLVSRRIRMHIEIWDRTSLVEQEQIVGRNKGEGAPLGQAKEFDEPDLHVKGAGGIPLIGEIAHIRLASPESLNGARILRRGYNFTDGSDGLGHLDAGLFFVAFNRDTRTQFVPMQQALSTKDDMMEYVEHTGSGHFAVPPGVKEGGFWGEGLFR
jgi:deferrochelatase/peroxidase EfeB